MLGHNKIKTTQTYLQVIESKISIDKMDLRNNFL